MTLPQVILDMDYDEDPDAVLHAIVAAHCRDDLPEHTTTVATVLADFLYPSIRDTTLHLGPFQHLATSLAHAGDILHADHVVHNIMLAAFLNAFNTMPDAHLAEESLLLDSFTQSLDRHEIPLYAFFFSTHHGCSTDIWDAVGTSSSDVIHMFTAAVSPHTFPIAVFLIHALLQTHQYHPGVSHTPDPDLPSATTLFALHILQHIAPTNGAAWQHLYAASTLLSIDIAGIPHDVDPAAFMHSAAAYHNICIQKSPDALAAIRANNHPLPQIRACFPNHWSRAGRAQPRAKTQLSIHIPAVYTNMYRAENILFALLLLAIQRLEDTAILPPIHHAVLETTLESWTNTDAYLLS